MMIIKLVALSLVLFLLFGGALLFTQVRKKKRKKACDDQGDHRCTSCSCDRF
jgi:hypothetical protein